ncbi:MAG: phosphate-starvation-inducible PsiE family protein [Gammaproteobacteria bacterium]|nr:phosphate-starvation-inducible PsiE family protein [Gammaproteobacteria bacterium]
MKVHGVFRLFEATLLVGILLALSVTLLLAFVDIAYVIYTKIMTPPAFIVDAQGLMDLFSLILILLIGLELIETVKTYLEENVVHVELVLLVAIIAIARKVVVWDFAKHTHVELYSLAAMVVALGVSYFLVKQTALKIPIGSGKRRGEETT